MVLRYVVIVFMRGVGRMYCLICCMLLALATVLSMCGMSDVYMLKSMGEEALTW